MEKKHQIEKVTKVVDVLERKNHELELENINLKAKKEDGQRGEEHTPQTNGEQGILEKVRQKFSTPGV